jgi:16S rRNA (adenine1518-N6/adenine1519-N6)-dimethyltransferase
VLDQITPSRARELIDRHGLWYRRSLGQHFLVDPNTARRIVRLAEVAPKETVLEIGPGLGSLTVALARAAARVVAVEIDEGVAGVLREVVGEDPGVEVVVADALRCDLGGLLGGPARLVANLPYNGATPLYARVLEVVPEVG